MGYAGKLKEKAEVRSLRKKGYSYSEILKKIKVSKGSLSVWCRDIVLTEKQIEMLCERAEDGRFRSRKIIGEKREAERRERIKKLREEGMREMGILSCRDRFLAGVGLYAGDGAKGFQGVRFSNSDPRIIKFMMEWLREFCKVPEGKFRGRIWIHDDQNELGARRFWSKTTDIPMGQFQKSYIAKNKKNSKKIRKKLHQYGIFGIEVSDAAMQRKILGWMTGILENNIIN